jgi:type IV pilus assembly protein PilC
MAGSLDKTLRDIQHLWEGVSPKDMVLFFRQLSALISAHVPILTALHAVSDQLENAYFRTILSEVSANVEDGMALSEAMAAHPRVFSQLIVHMMRAGEVSGNLKRSVNILADNIEKNYQLTSKIRGAMIYPSFVLTTGAVVGFVVISFILPKITMMIKDLHAETPWYTQVVMNIGDFMSVYWWVVALGVMIFVGALAYYLNTEGGKREWQHISLKLPVMGDLMRNLYVSRFAENVGALLGSGIPMVRTLTIVADVVGNDVYRNIILEASQEVQAGGAISVAFAKHPEEIPPIVSQMVKVGEETGEMDQILKSTAEFYSQEVDNTARNLVSLIEPIMIVGLALGVAVLVFSVILPIYSVVGQMGSAGG